MDELQEMREQMAALKEKLNKQEVVNDRLIRDVLIKKKKSVDKNIWFVGICGLITITIGNLTWSSWGVSSWFLIGTTVFVLVCILMTIIPHTWVKKEDIQSGNLLVAAKQVRRLRKLYKDWEIIGIVLAVIWLAWLFVEFSAVIENKQMLYILVGAAAIGGIIGGIIGLVLSRKTILTLDEMIQEIEETSELDEGKEETKK
jgi:hypothetical protein